MAGKYDDLLELPHHQSDHHPHMTIHDRAAQFSPFAALTGHKGVIEEEERLTEDFREPDESRMALLDRKLQILQENRSAGPEVRIRYFAPDGRKEGGAYREAVGRFRKADERTRRIVMADGTEVPVEEIWDIQSELFEDMGLD